MNCAELLTYRTMSSSVCLLIGFYICAHMHIDRVVISSMSGDVSDTELISVFTTPAKKNWIALTEF